MMIDPPELAQHVRRDPPIEEFPGRIRTTEDIMAACGDQRDWFRFWHRYNAALQAWAEFYDARKRRRNFFAGFEFKQILILGPYGAKKTTLGILEAMPDFCTGHPLFSDASCLVGWRIEGAEVYTVVGDVPRNSVGLFDEASATHASSVANNLGITVASEMNLNTRKQNFKGIWMTAHDWELSADIRRECSEVWLPAEVEELQTMDHKQIRQRQSALLPRNNPANFQVAYHVWEGYPYQKANLIEQSVNGDPKKGFGPPAYTMYDSGANVRMAFLLNDTFELAKSGFSRVVGKEDVRDRLAGITGVETPEDASRAERDRLFQFFADREDNPPAYFTPGEIAEAVGMDSRALGRLLQSAIPGVRNVQRYGYDTAYIYNKIREGSAA